MKKKYLPKKEKEQTILRGAYDKDNAWWCEDAINTFTSGLLKMCFNKRREQIKIIERKI